MANNMNKIEFDYNDRHYCLEYTPATIKIMEASGFSMSDFTEKPQTRIEQLWFGAFLAHERNVSDTVKKALYDEMKSKKLLTTLVTMYNNVLSNLLPDVDDADEDEYVGNVKWTATR